MHEQVEHDLLAFFRGLRVLLRTVSVRLLRDAADQRRLRAVQLGRVKAEVIPRGCLDAVDFAPAGNPVQILGQDLVLRVEAFQAARHGRLPELAEQAGAPVAQREPGDLHGDGGGAGDDLHVAEVLPQRAQDRPVVDAAVFIERIVLGGQHDVHRFRRDLAKRDREPPFVVVCGLVEHRDAVPVEISVRRGDLPQPDHRVVEAVRRDGPCREGEDREKQESRRCEANGFPFDEPAEPGIHFTSRTSSPAAGMNVPFMSGSYMASAWSAGIANLPGVVARTV